MAQYKLQDFGIFMQTIKQLFTTTVWYIKRVLNQLNAMTFVKFSRQDP